MEGAIVTFAGIVFMAALIVGYDWLAHHVNERKRRSVAKTPTANDPQSMNPPSTVNPHSPIRNRQ